MSDVLSSLDARFSEKAEMTSVDAPIISREAARASGAKRYFTGLPCPKGHVCERFVARGQCLMCNDEYQRSHRQNCREACRRHRIANRDVLLEKQRQYRVNNLEKTKESTRKYIAANPDKVRQFKKAWRHANKDRRNASQRKYANANRETVRASLREYYKNNKELFFRHNANRRAKKRAAEGSHTREDVAEIRRMQRDKCAYCGVRLNGRGHVDHIMALANGGSNWPANLQLTCKPCNLSKGAKDALEFARQQGLLL